ncbi:Mitochondrial ATPase complex subunit atp10 [Actinomortierella ambigua]|uniref:Mitochondrial ATPase complex subunit atp10 n=1 Tax=Actinomortierella ambigua TaxID=1343610 RepID=A0A9P6TWM7_9FUNG|nr:Mitochondrial ATPase complex subunit atp10 [Actinomortierella ambigua]
MRACRASTGSIQQVAVAPFSTSGRLWEQQQTVPPQQPPLQRRSKKDDEDDDDDTVPKTLPSPPYGGRFGVPDQPLSTKAIEQLKQQQQQQQQQQQGKGSKNRSPFSRAKDGMKHKVNDWTDQEKNLQKRKELLTDFQAGYFSEFSEINRTGAKLWFASPAMMTAEKALYMPNIVGTSLKTSETVELADLLKGKISLVSISGTRFGEEQTETFVKPFLERWPAGKPGSKVQLVELNIQENPLKAGLVRVMVPFVRKTIPEERHANYLLHYKSIKHLKDPLCMQNSYLGYVFLVDGNCKIRWGAHGKGTEAEIHTLLDSVQKLSERGK